MARLSALQQAAAVVGLLLLAAPALRTSGQALDADVAADAGLGSAFVDQASQMKAAEADEPLVCIIVRTYYGHGSKFGDGSLARILKSLRAQTYKKWFAQLLVYDGRPFPDMRETVRELGDDRIWVFAEWISHEITAKDPKGNWVKNYHNALYNMTDDAIRACPLGTKWVVVTNGDNHYDRHFLKEVVSAPPGTDAIAFDFYSRYLRPTWEPCKRLEAGEGLPMCKSNEFRFCQTDLAANALSYAKIISEDRRFGHADPSGASSANDGIVASELNRSGWKVHHVNKRCLVTHSPTPQDCALEGGVWDDSLLYSGTNHGGSCMTQDMAKRRMIMYDGTFELLDIDNVAHDPNSFGMAARTASTGGKLPLKCMRHKDERVWRQLETFGRVCAASEDLDKFPVHIAAHVWDYMREYHKDKRTPEQVANLTKEAQEKRYKTTSAYVRTLQSPK